MIRKSSNVKNNGQAFVEVIQKIMTQSMRDKIVIQTDGLSNAEIKDIICAMY